MKMSGARALVKSLENEGVKHIFGYPGGRLISVHHELHESKKIQHLLMRHEQVAAHAADAYARATGKVGVCMATSGPGATNLVTGIANAYMDSIPMVAITAQVGSMDIGTDAFQEADITGITLPIVKHSYLVKDATEIPRIVKEAFYIASTGRPGPVLIDLPSDMSMSQIEYDANPEMSLPGYKPTFKGHSKQVKAAAKMILASRQPVIYAGGGVILSNAAAELTALAHITRIPATVTLMGKGAIPETDELSLGMLGMHGTAYANHAISESDLIIAVGARFDDRVTGKLSTFAPNAKIIHIDVDPAEIGKNVKVDVPIVGDAKQILTELNKELKTDMAGLNSLPWAAWHDKIVAWKERHPLSYKSDGELLPQYVIEQINEVTKDIDAVITTGVGQHQMWAAQYIKTTKPRTFISSGGLGTMGFGVPSALGAQVGRPEAVVFDIDGDGSFQMVSQDMATATAYDLPVNICILNNQWLGMVRQWQELFWDKRYAYTDLTPGMPDFMKLAEAYGAVGIRVTKPEEVKPALKRAMKSKKPCILEFVITGEQGVFPMVPPGKGLQDMIYEAPEENKGGS
jgi:acetolactate synthase I/II/III large subunit